MFPFCNIWAWSHVALATMHSRGELLWVWESTLQSTTSSLIFLKYLNRDILESRVDEQLDWYVIVNRRDLDSYFTCMHVLAQVHMSARKNNQWKLISQTYIIREIRETISLRNITPTQYSISGLQLCAIYD